MAYGLDASINFPLERTPIQGLFAILAGIIVSLMETKDLKMKGISEKPMRSLPLAPILLGLGIVGSVATVISFVKYQSYVNQNYIVADTGSQNLMTADYIYSYGQAKNRIDGFFEITGAGRPNEHVMAMHAMSEGTTKRALQHLDQSIAIAPNQ